MPRKNTTQEIYGNFLKCFRLYRVNGDWENLASNTPCFAPIQVFFINKHSHYLSNGNWRMCIIYLKSNLKGKTRKNKLADSPWVFGCKIKPSLIFPIPLEILISCINHQNTAFLWITESRPAQIKCGQPNVDILLHCIDFVLDF